ncbi:MAG: hypothetical protein HW380_2957 [Magnetococcales bacterium]|nr:hypothetical protein [Magnetococcales bacterium]HIJ82989.1 hypothetical protein [Magnetococcales bacterium]
MGANEILKALNGSGLILSLVGESIRVAPPGKLTDEFRALIREHKAELVELLRKPNDPPPKNAHEFFAVYGKWPWNFQYVDSHPGRVSLGPEMVNQMFYHWCPECGRWAACGDGFNPSKGKLGRWWCARHDPTLAQNGHSGAVHPGRNSVIA